MDPSADLTSRFLQLACGNWITQMLHVAAELAIAPTEVRARFPEGPRVRGCDVRFAPLRHAHPGPIFGKS